MDIDPSAFKEFIVHLFAPILTGLVGWLLARQRSKSEISKIEAEARKIHADAEARLQESDTSKFIAIINAQEVRISELRQEISELRKEIKDIKINYEERIDQLWSIIIKQNPDKNLDIFGDYIPK
jgi:hypothetical protein